MRGKLMEESPVIMQEWDYDKNAGIDPDKFTGGSNKVVWWRCELGHSWEAQINKRFSRGQNCPYCAGQKVWVGFNDLKTTHPAVADEWDYAKNRERHPSQFSIGADAKIWWKCKKCGYSWQAVLYSRKNCGCPCCAGNILNRGVNDLKTVNPRLALEWDTERNSGISPDTIAVNSNKKVWWRCALGHSWLAGVAVRNRGNGCPYCANRKLLTGFNDLFTIAPELACEWNYAKNGELRPQDVLAGSHKSVWWICKNRHEWKTKIVNRRRGHGCPYDSGKAVFIGETDLKTCFPDICEEWDYVKNGNITPDKIACNSHKRYWWVCAKGHGYQASTTNKIRSRAYISNGCPYCAGKLPVVGETDFKTLYPDLAAEWCYEKNMSLRPENVVPGSHKKVWWRCEHGHSWKAAICNRVTVQECPYCSGLLAIPGETDFGALLPGLADEWDAERNEGVVSENFKPFSNKRVWWKCKNGHSWLSTVGARYAGAKCPYCYGKVQMRARLV